MKFKGYLMLQLIGLSCLLMIGHTLIGLAQPCHGPTLRQRQDVTAYVTIKYKIASGSDLTLVNDQQANDACFWRFDYATSGKAPIILYLSPDRAFITPELYDLRLDPLVEEKKRTEALMTMLVSGDPPFMGSINAPVTVVEFSDFECPYCQRLKDILEKEVLPKEAGKVRIAFKNFPLPMHAWAKPAAIMAACAALQNEHDFWEIHDFLFDNQRRLTSDGLEQAVDSFISTSTKLNVNQFKVCVDKELTLGIVSKDMAVGQQNGVRATPTVFVNGVRYQGVQSAAQLIEIIDRAARGQSQVVDQAGGVNGGAANQCLKSSARSN